MIEMARFDGVPPNMSVSRTTPLPSSTPRDAIEDLRAALLHVVVRADADGGDVALRPDDVLQSADQLLARAGRG